MLFTPGAPVKLGRRVPPKRMAADCVADDEGNEVVTDDDL
jgi:hypothetical protein